MTNEMLNPAPTQEQQHIKLQSIFFPYYQEKKDKLKKDENDRSRFVHYTTAEAALSIIRNKRMWMRNARCMSDYSEVQHGFRILNEFFCDNSNLNKFKESLNRCHPNIGEEAIKFFNQFWQNIQYNTYIFSISEHDDREDLHGRLSMWRAFGGTDVRVAIVFNVPLVISANNALKIMFSPVAYFKKEKVHAEINTVVKNIRSNDNFLRNLDRSVVAERIATILFAGVTCLKHEGFLEEREWRAIYVPKINPSPLMEESIEVIGGVPQIIYKLPLDRSVSADLADLDISHFVDRLIIGPSPYPGPIYEAFVKELANAGVPEAKNRVHISGIPIRA